MDCNASFECDGYIDELAKIDKSSSSPEVVENSDRPTEHVPSQDLLTTSVALPQPAKDTSLTITTAGRAIPQTAIFDLKTRSGRYKKEIKMEEITPSLWLKQVLNFIVAYHDGSGLFRDIQIQDAQPLTTAFEKDNTDAIGRLTVLLQNMIDTTRAAHSSGGGGVIEVYSPGKGVLELHSPFAGSTAHALPRSLQEQWVARGSEARLEGGPDSKSCYKDDAANADAEADADADGDTLGSSS